MKKFRLLSSTAAVLLVEMGMALAAPGIDRSTSSASTDTSSSSTTPSSSMPSSTMPGSSMPSSTMPSSSSSTSTSTATPGAEAIAAAPVDTVASPQIALASATVADKSGATIGQVENVSVDSEGKVDKLDIKLTATSKIVQLPAEKATFDSSNNKVVAQLTQSEIKKLPAAATPSSPAPSAAPSSSTAPSSSSTSPSPTPSTNY